MNTLLLLASLLTTAQSGPRTAIAVVPYTSSSSLAWASEGLADSLHTRLVQHPMFAAFSLRQVQAAMRNDGMEHAPQTEAQATRLGSLLGAHTIAVLAVEREDEKWGASLTLYNPKKQDTQGFAAGDVLALETQATKALAQLLGGKDITVTPLGTSDPQVWEHTAKAMELLRHQSLGPRAATQATRLKPAQLKEAKEHISKALTADANYARAHAVNAILLTLEAKMTEGWSEVGAATRTMRAYDPFVAIAGFFVRMRQARYGDAIKVLKQATQAQPGFLLGYDYLGHVLNHTGRHREALAVWNKYLEIVPNQPWALTRLGYTKSKRGDAPGALSDTMDAVKLLPDAPALLVELASRYLDAKRLIGARDTLMHALEKHPKYALAHIRMCYVELLEKQYDKAAQACKRGIKLAGTRTSSRDLGYAHHNLAIALALKGENEEATQHLQHARAMGIVNFSKFESNPKLKEFVSKPEVAKLLQP